MNEKATPSGVAFVILEEKDKELRKKRRDDIL